MPQEKARYIYVSDDKWPKILYELSEKEIEAMANDTFLLPDGLPEKGVWALISLSGSMERIDHIMNQFKKK